MNENNEQAKRQLQSGWLRVQTDLLVACVRLRLSVKNKCLSVLKPSVPSLPNRWSVDTMHSHIAPNANPFNPDLLQQKAGVAMHQRHFPMHKAKASHP